MNIVSTKAISSVVFAVFLLSPVFGNAEHKELCLDQLLSCTQNCEASCRVCTPAKIEGLPPNCVYSALCGAPCKDECHKNWQKCERPEEFDVQAEPLPEASRKSMSAPQTDPVIPRQDLPSAKTPAQEQSLAPALSPEPVQALVSEPPTEKDLIQYSIKARPVSYDEQGRIQAIVTELDGTADMQLPDGTWVIVEKGAVIPYGATVFSGFASHVELRFSDYLVIVLRSLSELNVEQFDKNPLQYQTNLNLGVGEIRFKVLEARFQSDLEVSTPNSSGRPQGTDFGVSYNKETGITAWEIYNGSIEVTNTTTDEIKTISSSYGSPIKRIEIANNEVMVEKIAIPQSEWEDFLAQRKKEKGRSSAFLLWAVAVAALGGIAYFMYRQKGALANIFKRSNIHK